MAESLPIPERIAGKYRLVRKLGQGGMAEVFLAEQEPIQKSVAVKILHADRVKRANQKERFLREARAAARIRHPNVVDISDFGEMEDGRAYVVMEYLDGQDLKRYLARKRILPWSETAALLDQICSALSVAHAHGVVHRDLKPDNIFLTTHKGKLFPKIVDFGLAKLIDDAGTAKLTKTGIIVGTPAFLAPEQVRGEKLDHRVDIYALGLIMYRMLCGQLPFKAKTVVQMLRKQLSEEPRPPSDVAPDALIPKYAEEIVLRALCKDPDERYSTMDEMQVAVRNVEAQQRRANKVRAPGLAPVSSADVQLAIRSRTEKQPTPESDDTTGQLSTTARDELPEKRRRVSGGWGANVGDTTERVVRGTGKNNTLAPPRKNPWPLIVTGTVILLVSAVAAFFLAK